MAVVTAPADTIILTVGAMSVECQVTSHKLTWADPAAGTQTRTGCGDVVSVPADSTQVGTLDLTVYDDRSAAGFSVWTRLNHGETADFVLVENTATGVPTALEYSGKVTVAAVPVQQTEYTKIETVDVSWSVTEFTNVATVPVP